MARADLWGRCAKALGVDLARQAVDDLVVLVGARGFEAGHVLQKARRDLEGLRYADGMHDSLYRSAGRTLLRSASVATSQPIAGFSSDCVERDSEAQRAA
jgi:alkylation response protein AidB-like acyl-CoA dehydrogenase